MNVFRIIPAADQNSVLRIHPEQAAARGLNCKKFACLCFGNQKHYVKIGTDPALPQDILSLSRNLIAELYLPDYPVYEMGGSQNEIIIGPFIGLLLRNEDRKLTSSRLNNILVYVKDYASLHGAVVVFALDKVNRENRRIEGYCYNPVRQCWQRGIFPYPAALYRTIGLNAAWKNHFLAVLGDKIFNSRFFNKWEMYQWLSAEPAIQPHLPETVLYHSPPGVLKMLARFPGVYIKPILGLQGRGIVRLNAANGVYTFQYRENRTNGRLTLEGPDRADEYMRRRFRPGRFLIQQALDLMEYQGGIVDFRCVLQKTQSNSWACKAIIGRSGVRDSIVSNISSGGAAYPAAALLRRTFSSSAADGAALQNKMASLAIAVCHRLDEYGINCGTLGLDIGVDTEGRLWLIEINNRDPDPGIALDIHDTALFYTLKTGPLFYAKYLAGFAAVEPMSRP